MEGTIKILTYLLLKPGEVETDNGREGVSTPLTCNWNHVGVGKDELRLAVIDEGQAGLIETEISILITVATS